MINRGSFAQCTRTIYVSSISYGEVYSKDSRHPNICKLDILLVTSQEPKVRDFNLGRIGEIQFSFIYHFGFAYEILRMFRYILENTQAV